MDLALIASTLSEDVSDLVTLYRSPRITVRYDMVILQIPNFKIFQEVHRSVPVGYFSNYKSNSFMLSTGYTFRIILYTFGQGTAREKYLSAYVELLSTDNSNTPADPFRGVITFVTIDQSGKKDHQTKSVKTRYQKPLLKESLPFGINELLPLDMLKNESTLLVKNQLIIALAIRYDNKVL